MYSRFIQIQSNPVRINDVVNIRLPYHQKNGESAPTILRLYDVSGKLLLERTVNQQQFQVPVTDVTPGTYMVQMVSATGQVATKRLLISQ